MGLNVGMANRQGDGDLRFPQVSVPQLTLLLGLVGLADKIVLSAEDQNSLVL